LISALLAPSFAIGLAALLGSGSGSEEAKLRALADRCGSQIEWMRDQIGPDDGGGAFKYVERGKGTPPRELKPLIGEALSRAREQHRLVLWHVYRLQGQHMYRAPNLDDYMDQVLWSDPALVELVTHRFVPLRTQCPKEIGKEYGLVAWDVVEPAIAFLTPDGKVVHRIDRIRTFDPRWFAEVLRRVLALHPDLDPGDARPTAADAFTTQDAALLETTRRSYYDGLDAYLSGDEKSALARWQSLTDDAPESPFAWRAAANLMIAPDKTWPGAARHGFEWPYESWLPEEGAIGGAIPTDTRWRRTPSEAASVAENAVRWLLHMQRSDGSWNDCRYAYWESPAITPNAWMAITALCATALTEWRDVAPAEVDAALARAEDYLFKSGRLNAGVNEECYAHAYRLLYLDRTLAQTEDPAQREELLDRARALVAQLAGNQKSSGQWAHEYDNAFCTAVVLSAVARAKAMGVDAPDATVTRGLDALAAARYEDGSFTYGGVLPKLPKGAMKAAPDQIKDSCGRMPVCESALFAWGRSDARALAKALSVYEQYFDRFEKVSKCDFHTDGELGGFFFFHDLYHASEAVLLLPAAGQRAFRRFFVEKIAALPEIDGSFLDDHELGKSCSTGYALLALKNVLDERVR